MNARQFFDVWALVVERVGNARANPLVTSPTAQRRVVYGVAMGHYGALVGDEAVTMFDRLRADARTGNMKR